jgi:DNA-binding response OmpR family regulator
VSPSRLVLLVDDDRDLLTALSGGLRRHGYEVAVALDAVAATSSAVRLRPDVVVLDVGLPGGEGSVVMKRMHALPQLAGVPVIVISGRDPERHRDEALAAGASAYLTKPVAVDDLAVAIRVALGEDAAPDAAGMQGLGGRLGDILKDMGLVTEEQIASALARQGDATTIPNSLGGKTVLVVDDDEDLLVAIAAPLRRRGLNVAVATDAVTAVSAAVKRPPDIVILDIGLPGGDGLTVMQRLHSLPKLAAVPVIVLSGRDPEKNREAALAAGAVAYLTKPVTPAALSAAVADALGAAPQP